MTTEAVRAIYLRRADGALISQMTVLHMAGNVLQLNEVADFTSKLNTKNNG